MFKLKSLRTVATNYSYTFARPEQSGMGSAAAPGPTADRLNE